MLEIGLVNYVAELQSAVQQYLSKVPLGTVHKHKGQVFHAQNKFCGKVWHDWAMIDWGDEGELPCKLWGFVDLHALPQGHNAIFENLPLKKSIYAVVEAAHFVDDEEKVGLSEIFVPITKEIGGLTNNAVSHMKFFWLIWTRLLSQLPLSQILVVSQMIIFW